MKLLHLGDLHLGKSLLDFDLIEDQRYMLDQVLAMIQERKIDAVLMAGDIYDKSIPSEAATRLLDFFISRLAAMKVETFIISGNHDSDERLNFGSALFEANNIHISSVFSGKMSCYSLVREGVEADIYLLPFVKASEVRRFYPDVEINDYDAAVRCVIGQSQLNKEHRNIIVAHQFVAGKLDPTLGGSEGLATKSVGLVERVGYDCFEAFDYAALGHIHSPQKIGKDTIRYSGSLLKYSLSEANNEKSVPIITIKAEGEPEIELVPLVPVRNLRHLKGSLINLLDKKNISRTEDYIYATLTDEDVIPNVMAVFREIYPNTVHIDYDNSHVKDIETVDITNITEDKSFHELISDFYELVYGENISDEEMAVMKEVAGKVGILNETN